MFSTCTFKFAIQSVATLPVAKPRGLAFSHPLEHVLSIPQSRICLRLQPRAISEVGLPSADNIPSNGEKRTNVTSLCEVSLAHSQQQQVKTQVQLPSALSKHHAMKMYGEYSGGCNLNIDLAKDGSEWSALPTDEFTIGTHQIGGWKGLRTCLDAAERKTFANAGNQYSIS